MKRIITIILTLTLVFSSCVISTFADSSTGTGYVKVKKSVYLKYKRAYNENVKLKKTIKQQKNTIKQLRESADDKDSTNSWLWMNVKSLGLSYSDKTWTVPNEFPDKFIINGTTYKVIKEE